MRELLQTGFTEAAIALSMFTPNAAEKKELLKKAADDNNPEGLWGYCCMLPHSYCPNPNNPEDINIL